MPEPTCSLCGPVPAECSDRYCNKPPTHHGQKHAAYAGHYCGRHGPRGSKYDSGAWRAPLAKAATVKAARATNDAARQALRDWNFAQHDRLAQALGVPENDWDRRHAIGQAVSGAATVADIRDNCEAQIVDLTKKIIRLQTDIATHRAILDVIEETPHA